MAAYTIKWYSGIVILNWGNRVAQDIWEKDFSRLIPRELCLRAKVLLTIMHSTSSLNDLKVKGQPPQIRLHKLQGDLKDHWSVTIKLPWCIIFKFRDGNFSDVRIVDYH